MKIAMLCLLCAIMGYTLGIAVSATALTKAHFGTGVLIALLSFAAGLSVAAKKGQHHE